MRAKITFLTALFLSILCHSQSIEKFSIDSGGASASAGGIQILYTIGEVNIAERTSATVSLSEGFINSVQVLIKIDPTIFLQGPYSGGVLSDALRSSGNIPTTSPYTDGLTCDVAVFNTTGNDAIVDWVWIEVRETDGTTVTDQTSALIQSDGDVVATDGTSSVIVDAPDGNYLIMISHRNHIGVLTANPIVLAKGSTATLNLSTDSALVMGGSNGISDMGDGNFALFSGDFNGDGQVQNTDKNAVQALIGISGLTDADLDMNNQVQNTDIQNKLNPNIGKGEQFSSRTLDLKLYAKRKKDN